MSTPVRIVAFDTDGNKRELRMTRTGALAVSQLYYDESQYLELAEPDTAYSFFGPKAGQQFVITNIIMFADKQVSATTNALVEIYEGLSADATTPDKTLLKMELGQLQSMVIPVQNLLVSEGLWVNAQTDDDDVHMNILGHYIPVERQI